MIDSTENATSSKSTKSKNSKSSLQIQIKLKFQFEFVPQDTQESECLDFVSFGSVSNSEESSFSDLPLGNDPETGQERDVGRDLDVTFIWFLLGQ